MKIASFFKSDLIQNYFLMKKKMRSIIICVMVSFLLVFSLQLYSIHCLNKKGQDFLRTYFSSVKKPEYSVDLGNSDYYFAGHTASHIYLGNYHNQNLVLGLSANLKDSLNYFLTGPEHLFLSKSLKIMIDSPRIFVVKRENCQLYSCTIHDNLSLALISEQPFFAFDAKIIPGGIIIKYFDTVTAQNILSKYDFGGHQVRLSKEILQKQSDGIIGSDGLICYNPSMHLINYIYYYRNQIICLDTSLAIKYRRVTIDTNSYAKISLRYLKSGGYTTFSAPPPFINKTSCVSGNWIYIQSTMIAKSDFAGALQDNSIIDVYNAKSGNYKGSFYLPDFKEEKLRSIEVISDRLFALHGNHISIYSLPIF